MPKLKLNIEEIRVDSFETPVEDTLSLQVTPRTNEPGCVPGSAQTVCFC